MYEIARSFENKLSLKGLDWKVINDIIWQSSVSHINYKRHIKGVIGSKEVSLNNHDSLKFNLHYTFFKSNCVKQFNFYLSVKNQDKFYSHKVQNSYISQKIICLLIIGHHHVYLKSKEMMFCKIITLNDMIHQNIQNVFFLFL